MKKIAVLSLIERYDFFKYHTRILKAFTSKEKAYNFIINDEKIKEILSKNFFIKNYEFLANESYDMVFIKEYGDTELNDEVHFEIHEVELDDED